jgi:hypothetical protein
LCRCSRELQVALHLVRNSRTAAPLFACFPRSVSFSEFFMKPDSLRTQSFPLSTDTSATPMSVGSGNDGAIEDVAAAPRPSGLLGPATASAPATGQPIDEEALISVERSSASQAVTSPQPSPPRRRHRWSLFGPPPRYKSPHHDPSRPFPDSKLVAVISDPGVSFIWHTKEHLSVPHSFVPRPKSGVRIGPQLIAPNATWEIIDYILANFMLDIWDFETGGPIGVSLTAGVSQTRPWFNWMDVRGAGLRPRLALQPHNELSSFGGFGNCHAPFSQLEADAIRARVSRAVRTFSRAGRLWGPWFVAKMRHGEWWRSTMDVYMSLE